MSRRPHGRRMTVAARAGDDEGSSLAELLIAMALAMIVLFAILQVVDVLPKASKAGSDRVQAQETARTSVRHLVQRLREGRRPAGQTTPLASAHTPTRQDLVLAAYVAGSGNPAPGSTEGWLRYCVSGDGRSLLVGVLATSAYAAPGTCATSTTTNGWSYGPLVDRTLVDRTTVFDYSSGSCVAGRTVGSATAAACSPTAAAINAVGVRIAVARDPESTTGSAVVRDAVTLRNGSTS